MCGGGGGRGDGVWMGCVGVPGCVCGGMVLYISRVYGGVRVDKVFFDYTFCSCHLLYSSVSPCKKTRTEFFFILNL